MKPIPFLICGLLLMFVGFKLSGIIDWSWWWVLAPLWACPVLALAIFLASAVCVFVWAGFRSIFPKRRRGNAP